MPKSKAEKQKIVEKIQQDLNKARSVVFVDIQGLKSKDQLVLRRKLKGVDGGLKIAKKTLISLAMKNFPCDNAADSDAKNLEGEIALVIANKDELNPLKSAFEFSRQNENLKIIGGIFDQNFYAGEKIMEIAQLPGKEELLARLVGSLASPMSGLANVLQGNLKDLVVVLSKIKK